MREGKLSDLPNKRLSVLVSDNGVIALTLSYQSRAVCYRVGGDIQATVDGYKMELLEQGDRILGSETGDKCRYPLWESPSIPVLTETQVALRDGSARIAASYTQLFTARAMALVGAPIASVGERVTLEWSPVTDVYDPSSLQVVFAPLDQSGVTIAKGVEQITTLDHSLSFTLPPESPRGAGRLVVVGEARVQSTVCQGVDECLAEYRVAAVVDFTIQ